ncbi:ABC transporter permease [Aminipila butyrica]|uniref:ABC transporter permease n=1 Tax=Aminipila butyrica TaxID=433296 RepID=A0A858BTC8_9FIRM|nr:ABC transporter permease [Aminipila butyrica]QIB68024.1 ABC transporter permease [Aminipila butyrica]
MNNDVKNKRNIGSVILYIALPLILIAVWQGYNLAGKLTPYTMPEPMAIINTAIDYIQNGKLFENVTVSFIRVIEGFLLALVSAFIIGINVSIFPKFNLFTDLLIQILRPIPPIAWIPLAILWFGIGQESKIFIIFLGAFFPIFVNTVDGVRNIDSKYFELSQVYEVSRQKLIRKIIIPGALPSIMTGIRLGLGNAWVCVVAAEMIGATSGVGYMLSDGRSLSRPDIVILGMLIVGIVGKIMDDLLKLIREKLITWN